GMNANNAEAENVRVVTKFYFVLKMPLHYSLQILLMVFLSFTTTLLLSETVHFLIKRWKRWRSR
ncbi:MAG: hypothetical protein II684_07295, partial [Treponema sp.]|nr:hypothetical protein [Treponema sp.]